ncbi:hypothetical protein [Paenisporosarcina cavernae]|uniref:Uncharacterized protein n=1 Tax=Paenisporosarcina cavernae TaxID=2320858 RepID=A0A385YY74_9BACL|nr:hypothetical protein [Paenisporosarcina cavernae]AYC30578.1 hypothetical protein D3873_12385 [Paenisporosarcina cavernae]
MSSNRNHWQNCTIQDLFRGKDLDIIAASLLLLGKLKVDSIEVYRDAPEVTVSLVGNFKTKTSKNTMDLASFIASHGDMSLDEIIQAFQQSNKG